MTRRAVSNARHKLAVAILRSGPGLTMASGNVQPSRRVRRAEERLEKRMHTEANR